MIFDASNYLPDLAARIKAEHKAVGDALNSAVMHAMAAGDLLAEANQDSSRRPSKSVISVKSVILHPELQRRLATPEAAYSNINGLRAYPSRTRPRCLY
jgi:hypothetical protein